MKQVCADALGGSVVPAPLLAAKVAAGDTIRLVLDNYCREHDRG